MPIPMLNATASLFLKKLGDRGTISKNLLFDFICQMWVMSLVLP